MILRRTTLLVMALMALLPFLLAAAPSGPPVLTERSKVRSAEPGTMLVQLARDTTFAQPKGRSVPFAYDVEGLAAVALVQADAKPGARLGVLSVWLGREWGRPYQLQVAIGMDDPFEPVRLPAGRYWLHTVSDGEPVNANIHIPTAEGEAAFRPAANRRNTVVEAANQLPTDGIDSGRLTYSGGHVHELRSDGYLFGMSALESSHVMAESEHYCLYLAEPTFPYPYLPGCPSVETDALYVPSGGAAVLPGESFRIGTSFGVGVTEPATIGFGAYRLNAGVPGEWKGFEQFSLEYVPQER